MFVLASAFRGNEHKSNHFASKVLRAFTRKPHVYSRFMTELSPITLKYPDGKVEHSASFKVDLERFNNSLFQIACGLFYYQHKKKWKGGFKVLTNEFVSLDSPNAAQTNEIVQRAGEKVSKAFENQTHHGENKKIFSYSIISDKHDRHVIFMKFYEEIEITVLLENPQ